MVHRTNKNDIFIYVIESCRNMDQPYYLDETYKQRVKKAVGDLSDDEDSEGTSLNLSHYLYNMGLYRNLLIFQRMILTLIFFLKYH